MSGDNVACKNETSKLNDGDANTPAAESLKTCRSTNPPSGGDLLIYLSPVQAVCGLTAGEFISLVLEASLGGFGACGEDLDVFHHVFLSEQSGESVSF